MSERVVDDLLQKQLRIEVVIVVVADFDQDSGNFPEKYPRQVFVAGCLDQVPDLRPEPPARRDEAPERRHKPAVSHACAGSDDTVFDKLAHNLVAVSEIFHVVKSRGHAAAVSRDLGEERGAEAVFSVVERNIDNPV